MCGLAAVLLSPGPRKKTEWQELIKIFTLNLLENEIRGKEATGIAIIQSDGSYQIFKKSIPASSFIKTTTYKSALSRIDQKTVCILGHTREPTKGIPARNANNHPIRTFYVIGVHNGHIKNDDALFQENKLPRTGEVDSEIIFRLINKINPRPVQLKSYLKELNEQISKLRGEYTFLAVDLRNPTHLIILKQHKPLSMHYEEKLGALMFSSKYLFLRKLYGSKVINETISYRYINIFDAKLLPLKKHQPILNIKFL